MLNIQELRSKYKGKRVSTSDPVPKDARPWFKGDTWGGAGIVEDFIEQDGHILIVMDWGMGWAITEDTVIEEIE